MADASTTGGLERKIRRLEAVLEASKTLNSALDFDRLLALILDLAVKNLDATRGAIYLLDEDRDELVSRVVKADEAIEIRVRRGVGIVGEVAFSGETLNVAHTRSDPRFFSELDPQAGMSSRNMLCMPMRNREGRIVGVFQLVDKKSADFDGEDEHFLAAFAGHAAITLEAARLQREAVAKRLLEQELRFAAEIQGRLLQHGELCIPGYEVAGATRPTRSIGGDYFDMVQIGERRVVLVVADVAGKGLPAALLVSTLHAALHAYLQVGLALEEILPNLHAMLLETTTPEHYATLFLGDLDISTHTLRYVNAGHPAPLLLHHEHERRLEATGVPVGLLPGSAWQVATVLLGADELLLAYSDGVTEATGENGDEFGEERLCQSARRGPEHRAADVLRRIGNDVREFTGQRLQSDDQTLLVLKRLE